MRISLQSILLFLLIGNTVLANSSIDSLKNKIKTEPDNCKAELFIQLSGEFYSIKADSAIRYAKEALKWAKNFKNRDLIYNSYIELYYNYILKHDTKLAKDALDSAKTIAFNSQDSAQICDIYNTYGAFYSATNQYDIAIRYFNQSMNLSKLLDEKRTEIYNLIGLGEIYYERGERELALHHFQEAAKYEKDINDDVKLSLLINIGNIYADEKQTDKAKSYYHQAQEIASSNKDDATLSVLYNNLAIIYQGEADFKKALIYYRKSLDIDKKSGDKAGIALCLNNIGENYFKMGKFKKAIACLRESLSTNRKLNLRTEIIYNLEVLAQIHLSTKNFNQAYKCLQEGLQLSGKTKTKGKKADLLVLLAKYYNKIGDNKKAYSTLIKYNSLRDSLHNVLRTERILQLQAQFESERKEKENELLKIKNQFTQEQLEQEKLRSHYLYLFSILALLVIILIFILLRSKIKVNVRIKHFNQKLEESNSQLKIMNATKDKFFSIIAHDLRSPFNSILGFSDMITSELNNGANINRLISYNESVKESAQGLFSLLENLLQWANSQRGKIEFSPTQFDLYELIQANLKLFRLKTEDKSIKLSSNIQPGTRAYGDINMINTIVRNLISNALKFTNKNGEIFLSSKHDNDFVLLSVQDSGIGISKENQEKLFRIDCNFTTFGTDNETGSGLGLILCKEFIDKHGGNIYVESKLNKGSRFTFSLKSA